MESLRDRQIHRQKGTETNLGRQKRIQKKRKKKEKRKDQTKREGNKPTIDPNEFQTERNRTSALWLTDGLKIYSEKCKIN